MPTSEKCDKDTWRCPQQNSAGHRKQDAEPAGCTYYANEYSFSVYPVAAIETCDEKTGKSLSFPVDDTLT